jgi:hypothetical protein
MVPTMDHIERQSTNKTPSTGKLNYETNKSVSLDRWAKMWPTPNASPRGPAKEFKGVRPSGAKEALTLQTAVKMWQTPVSDDSVEREKGKWNSRGEPKLSAQVKLWPTPAQRDGKGGYQGGRIRNGKISRDTLDVTVQHTDNQEKTGGQLNPMWVAWLMGYPLEWLSCVPWETQSSRKSHRR